MRSGIGTAIKDALRSDSRTFSSESGRRSSTPGYSANEKTTTGTEHKSSVATDRPASSNPGNGIAIGVSELESQHPSNMGAASSDNMTAQKRSSESYDLPSGSGPGTTGKPIPSSDRGADAGPETAVGTSATVTGKGMYATLSIHKSLRAPEFGDHRQGHLDKSSVDVMPSGRTSESIIQLKPVTHEHVRHVETEEVQRTKEHERHIHHIQHHTQPIVASDVLDEKHHENVHAVTLIHESHVNMSKDSALLGSQMGQHCDTVDHGAKEHTVIDKGMVVNEHTYHHVHHVVQPVIEKEIIDKHRVHTTIPIHEVTHEAPIIHQSRTHDPVPIEHYLKHGGTLAGSVRPEDVSTMLLQQGQCVREVNGVAERLEKELQLDNINTITTKDIKRLDDEMSAQGSCL
ncbi:hypothetical protein AX15_005945 [Amanita polypyramis BW_CC]|nr:hypothetical protein AX15_005945 [Amanita polypyramis BW_CC]